MVVDDSGEFGLTPREAAPNREAPNRHTRGSKKYKEMVERGSRDDAKKNLPFTFSKPKRPEVRPVLCECPGCGRCVTFTKSTVMVICSACSTLYSVNEETTIRR